MKNLLPELWGVLGRFTMCCWIYCVSRIPLFQGRVLQGSVQFRAAQGNLRECSKIKEAAASLGEALSECTGRAGQLKAPRCKNRMSLGCWDRLRRHQRARGWFLLWYLFWVFTEFKTKTPIYFPTRKKIGMITLKCFSNTHFRANLRSRYKEHFEAIMDEMAASIPAIFPNGLFTPWK